MASGRGRRPAVCAAALDGGAAGSLSAQVRVGADVGLNPPHTAANPPEHEQEAEESRCADDVEEDLGKAADGAEFHGISGGADLPKATMMSSAAAVIKAIAMTTSNRKMALSMSSTVGPGSGLRLPVMAGRWPDGPEIARAKTTSRVKLRASLLLRQPEGKTCGFGSWGLASLGPVNPAFASLFSDNI